MNTESGNMSANQTTYPTPPRSMVLMAPIVALFNPKRNGERKAKMQVSKNFDIREFIPPEAFQLLGDKARWLIDPRLIAVVQGIRDLSDKPVTLNNWHTGGKFKESGFRMPTTGTGAPLSQHRLGRAADLKVAGMAPAEVLALIEAKWDTLRALGLTTVEDVKLTPTWMHVDVRATGHDTLLIVGG
jgi:hypothetical protein